MERQEFSRNCHGIVFERDDLARLEKTMSHRVLLADDRISDTEGGGDKFNKYPSALLRWGRLGRHFPEVRDRLIRYSRLPDLGLESTTLALGIAILSLPPAEP